MGQWGQRLGRRTVGLTLVIAAVVVAVTAFLAEQVRAPEMAPYTPAWGVLALTTAVLGTVGAGLVLSESKRIARAELRVLSWWWVLAGILLIVFFMWGATAVLLALADTTPDVAKRVELRLDAVKTGLTVGAGAAGLVALVLGVRRQWLGERTQAYQEYDATEKRVTELYTKATDQLGHDKAAVRLAGLYALERVAQHNPDHRQTIVDVLCAYLRMPPPLTKFTSTHLDEAEETLLKGTATDPRKQEIRALVDPQELQVRIAAQRILRDHLRWNRSEQLPPAAFWPDIDLDLTGAWLMKLDMTECRLRQAGFGSAVFEGFARFDRSTFNGRTVFAGAVFIGQPSWEANYRVGFLEVAFEDEAVFRETTFAQKADFRHARFASTTLFNRAVFKEQVIFQSTIFIAETTFNKAAFSDEAVFRQAEFAGPISFREAAFDTPPVLDEATVRTAPDSQCTWPTGWHETPHPHGSGFPRLVYGTDPAKEPLVPIHTSADTPDNRTDPE